MKGQNKVFWRKEMRGEEFLDALNDVVNRSLMVEPPVCLNVLKNYMLFYLKIQM